MVTVAKAFLFGVDVPVHLHGVTAEFRHCQNAFIRLGGAQRFYINMPALEVPASLVKPARSVVHQACRVVTFQPVRGQDRVKLSPTFVEWHPDRDTGEVVEGIDQLLEFLVVFLAVFWVIPAEAAQAANVAAVDPGGKSESHHSILGDIPAVGHILPDNHAETVAGVIPACRLHLNVLADHIAADLFGVFDVEQHRRFAGGGVEPLGEVALIERTILKDGLIVERKAPEAFVITGFSDLAHGEVARHLVHHHAVHFQAQGQVIEMGMVGMPLVRVGDVQQHLAGSFRAGASHFLSGE